MNKSQVIKSFKDRFGPSASLMAWHEYVRGLRTSGAITKPTYDSLQRMNLMELASLNRTGGRRMNRAGKVHGVKIVGGEARTVRAGKVRADRTYSFDELPDRTQRDHADWASEDTQFVRIKYAPKGGQPRYEFVPMENFMRVPSGKSPSGRPADGFASDSYFSGTAIKFIPGGEGSDYEYQVWNESW